MSRDTRPSPANVRTAAFVSRDPSADAVRLATAHDVELILVEAPDGIAESTLPAALSDMLETSPADVGILSGRAFDPGRGSAVFVPFGGGEHEWAALELGARIALTAELPLRLVGPATDPLGEARDASRLLADASLALQRVTRVACKPVLADPGEGLIRAITTAAVVVAGMTSRWRSEGIGPARRALLDGVDGPVVLVHRGPRPGALAPSESRTRFSWSLV